MMNEARTHLDNVAKAGRPNADTAINDIADRVGKLNERVRDLVMTAEGKISRLHGEGNATPPGRPGPGKEGVALIPRLVNEIAVLECQVAALGNAIERL